MRQLTGQVEQLQYRNQQLEQQLARGAAGRSASAAAQRGAPAATAIRPAAGLSTATARLSAAAARLPPQQDAYPPGPPPAGGRRGDAFDPNQNPNAPGVPRTLGGRAVAAAPPLDNQASDEEPVCRCARRPSGRRAARSQHHGGGSRERAADPARGAPDSRRAAAASAAQSERNRSARRPADGDGAERHAEGRIRPRLRLCAAQGLRARRGLAARLHEEVSGRPSGGATRTTGSARRCSSASATAMRPRFSSKSPPSMTSRRARRTRSCGSASRSRR